MPAGACAGSSVHEQLERVCRAARSLPAESDLKMGHKHS